MATEQDGAVDKEKTMIVDEDFLLTKVCWDERMQLTITKNFNTERTEILSGGRIAKDDQPAQRRFTCTICQQAFLYAAACLSHICTHEEGLADLHNDHFSYSSTHSEKQQEDDSSPENPVDYSQRENGNYSNNETVNANNDSGQIKHRQPDEEKSVLLCSYCPGIFASTDDLNRHLKQCNDEGANEIHEIKLYGKTFQHSKFCKQHFCEKNLKEKDSDCICTLSFSTKSNQAKHNHTPRQQHDFKCDTDSSEGTSHDSASFSRLQGQCERPHVCPHCPKAFKMKSHLREHVRLHTGERPFVCERCGVSFAQSNGLKSHAKQHSLERANQCDICHKAFSRPQILQMHRKTHDGEKPFLCDLCPRRFLTAANLGAHKKLKHGRMAHCREKLFTCDVCGASFSQACNLGIHKKKKHSTDVTPGQKIFFCDVCDASFSEVCNLGSHKKIKHTEQSESGRTIFACDICGAKFYRESNLSGHKNRKHKGKCKI